MLLTAVRMSVAENLAAISTAVTAAYTSADATIRAVNPPRLVAVSKTKPIEMIIEAYNSGHRDFGENYVQELDEKSHSQEILSKCPEIRWHFIGNCQTNKVNKLMGCPRLTLVETVTSAKLASKMNAQIKDGSPVGVFVQVNTSGEENKNGIEPPNVTETVKHILENCPKLKFSGLMTIGDLGNSVAASSQGSNPDFETLRNVRRAVAEATKLREEDIELSMGMSKDFEEAIRMGSTNVRVGSSIFGARNYAAKETGASGAAATNDEQVNKITEKLSNISHETVKSD